MSKELTDLREATSFEGLVALGVDTTKNESVQVPLGFVKQGADAAVAAAQSATTAAQAAGTAANNANSATTAAAAAASRAETAAELANIEALAAAAQLAADRANSATELAAAAASRAETATNTIDTKIEGKLSAPTVAAPSAAAINSLVGLNAEQEPVRVSLNQIRESVGIDYSLLTEQAVPGEFLPDLNGVKKQVYYRTFVGITPVSADRIALMPGVQNVWWVSGFIETSDGELQPPYIVARGSVDYYYCIGVGGGGGLIVHDIGLRYRGARYVFTFKYIKA